VQRGASKQVTCYTINRSPLVNWYRLSKDSSHYDIIQIHQRLVLLCLHSVF